MTTQGDNVRDMVERGRHVPASRLTPDDVRWLTTT